MRICYLNTSHPQYKHNPIYILVDHFTLSHYHTPHILIYRSVDQLSPRSHIPMHQSGIPSSHSYFMHTQTTFSSVAVGRCHRHSQSFRNFIAASLYVDALRLTPYVIVSLRATETHTHTYTHTQPLCVYY